MGDQHNFAALDWVVGEIEETLDEARQALEAYVEDPKDSTRIRFCLTHIHQVLGSLRMVEFNGPALLAEEMEHVAQGIMNNTVSSVSDALEILMRSLLQLPIYLNHIRIYRDDSATYILPLLNDLRAVRKEHYLSESNLFAPNLTSLNNVTGKRHPILDDPQKLVPLLKKLREMYQFAAAGVLRGLKVDENLDYLEKVFTRLDTLSGGTLNNPLWAVAAALIEGIKYDEIELSVGVRGLLRYLARDLRVLAEQAPKSFAQLPNKNLLKNLLFYVGRAGSSSKKVNAVKERYNLAAALKNSSTDRDNSHSGPALDPEAIKSVVVALVDELNSIKMNLNNTLTGHLATDELKDVLPVLKRVADTLAVLGISELRKQMLDQVSRLNALSNANELDEAELTSIATNIIEVEQRLEAIGKAVGKAKDINKIDERKVEIDEAKLVVVKECQFGLEKAKDAIVDYISSNWDVSRLDNIDSLLADIRGGLEIIPLLRPASIVRACNQFIKEKLVESDEQPEWATMELLADAIASVDYYLERLLGDMSEDANVILDRAEESIKDLGFASMLAQPSEQERLQAEAFAKEAQAQNDATDDVDKSAVHTHGSMAVSAEEYDAANEDVANANVAAEQHALNHEINSSDLTQVSTDNEQTTVDEQSESVVPVNQTVADAQIAAVEPEKEIEEEPEEEPEEESDIDDEILEIFIEEAGEVLETLNEYLPQWITNNNDQEALTTVRRAFHTLKGSGRMVEASDISELAWEVENMLNRIIDNSVDLAPEHGQLIENVLELLPALVTAFEKKKRDPDPEKNQAYRAWAKSLSKGVIPDDLFQFTPVDVAPQDSAVKEDSRVEENTVPENDVVAVADPQGDVINTAEGHLVLQDEEDDDDEQEDMVLWEIFSSEAKSHLATIEEFVAQMESEAPIYSPPSDDLQRALHTLKGSAKMAQVTDIARMAEPLENFAKELVTYQVPINDDILQLIRDAAEYTHLGLETIEHGRSVEIPKLDQFLARTAELRELSVGHLVRLKELDPHSQSQVDPRLLSIFMAEEMLLLLDADQLLTRWESDTANTDQIVDLISELSKLAEGAAQANLPDMALLSESLRCVYERMMSGELPTDSEIIEILRIGHNALLDMVDAVAAGQTVQSPPEDVVNAIQALIERTPDYDAPESANDSDEFTNDRDMPDTYEAANDRETSDSHELADSENLNATDLSVEDTADYIVEPLEPEHNSELERFETENVEDTEISAEENTPEESISSDEKFVAENEELASHDEEIVFVLDEHASDDEYLPLDNEDTDSADVSSDDTGIAEENADGSHRHGDFSLVDEDAADVGYELHDNDVTFDVDYSSDSDDQAESRNDNNDTPDEEIVLFESAPVDELIEPEAIVPDDIATASESVELEASELERFETENAEDEILLVDSVIESDSEDDVQNLDEPITEIHFETEMDDNDVSYEIHELTETNEFVSDEGAEVESQQDSTDLDSTDLDTTYLDSTKLEVSEFDATEIEANVFDSDADNTSQSEEPVFEGSDTEETAIDFERDDEIDLVSADESLDVIETPLLDITLDEPEQAAAELELTRDSADVAVIPGLLDTIDRDSEDFDEDIIEVFLEEADELSEDLDEAIHTWQSDWNDLEPVEEIKRALHTYKGGARLASLMNLGELTHDYETYIISVKPSDVGDEFFNRIHVFQDRLLSAVRAVKAFMATGLSYADASASLSDSPVEESSTGSDVLPSESVVDAVDQADDNLKSENEPVNENDTVVPDQTPSFPDIARGNVVPFARSKPAAPSEPSEFSMPTISNGLNVGSALAKKAAPQELVKVPAELLEELVNLAGETSISRARLEEQVTEFSYSLDEIDATLHRMQEQIRRLDIETEAQILFRQEQLAAHEEFDPLEMDRYSQLQQLSRSLIESASDLEDLKTELNEKLRDTETLLVQQSRINTSLQEGLMRSRMVPFSRLVPRLRRIVRQVATELGKNVSFELDNIEGELDRTVLERMVPPFEHMLRNAVDHGIEMPNDRITNGKAETGRIVLTLGREGGDVIIRLADDGRGINLKRVREKAIERELMSPNAELSDHDVMQFILHAGFSTAENITQISGRGVGMDVVHSEIKQLGGSVVINSEWGKGTEFVVRLPFTLSVNRALMVEIGLDQYAIPLSSIEGIVRVSPFELEHYYSNADAQFEYANENYHVRYLGSMLNTDLKPKLEGHVLPLPVLLVRSAEHTMALQVDGLLGSREVVVKNLGPQFSTVLGLSGATVMGDGSVVVILDPHALVRQEIAIADNLLHSAPLELTNQVTNTKAPEQIIKTIMVVDDSVTVRKVTTRFLERQGFDVITAKDGVDALRVLQDRIPDLMLLDIEMPRMDGFEVAKNVRSTSRWSELPIIMITSRTGEKHREHAYSLGVNNYLGKPYQEDILLSAINELLDPESVVKH